MVQQSIRRWKVLNIEILHLNFAVSLPFQSYRSSSREWCKNLNKQKSTFKQRGCCNGSSMNDVLWIMGWRWPSLFCHVSSQTSEAPKNDVINLIDLQLVLFVMPLVNKKMLTKPVTQNFGTIFKCQRQWNLNLWFVVQPKVEKLLLEVVPTFRFSVGGLFIVLTARCWSYFTKILPSVNKA